MNLKSLWEQKEIALRTSLKNLKTSNASSSDFDQNRFEVVSMLWWITLIFTLPPVLFLGFHPWFFGGCMLFATGIILVSDLYDILRK